MELPCAERCIDRHASRDPLPRDQSTRVYPTGELRVIEVLILDRPDASGQLQLGPLPTRTRGGAYFQILPVFARFGEYPPDAPSRPILDRQTGHRGQRGEIRIEQRHALEALNKHCADVLPA